MRLTVVGGVSGLEVASEIYPGYLVTSGETSLLMDCGPGVAMQLSRYTPLDHLAGIVISHMDLSHYFDLLPLALIYSNQHRDILLRANDRLIPPMHFRPLPIYVPAPGAEWLTRAITFLAVDAPSPQPAMAERMRTAFDLHEYEPDTPFAIGPFTVQAIGPVAHEPGRCFGFRVSDGIATVGYTGDTGMCDALYAIARDTDLFLCDATDISSQIRTDNRHLSAEEAGQVAAGAEAKQLVLAHVLSNARAWTNTLIKMARRYYTGPIHIARQNKIFDLPAHTFP